MRASPLIKQYGWGAHYNDKGGIAIYPVEDKAYQRFVADNAVKKFNAAYWAPTIATDRRQNSPWCQRRPALGAYPRTISIRLDAQEVGRSSGQRGRNSGSSTLSAASACQDIIRTTTMRTSRINPVGHHEHLESLQDRTD